MMGHRGPTISGTEVDALNQHWRRIYHWKSGTRRWIKRKFNKRMRAAARIRALVSCSDECGPMSDHGLQGGCTHA